MILEIVIDIGKLSIQKRVFFLGMGVINAYTPLMNCFVAPLVGFFLGKLKWPRKGEQHFKVFISGLC